MIIPWTQSSSFGCQIRSSKPETRTTIQNPKLIDSDDFDFTNYWCFENLEFEFV